MISLLLLVAAPETRNVTILVPEQTAQARPRAQAALVDFVPGLAECAGVHARAISTADPLTVGAMLSAASVLPEVELRFRLTPDGRPVRIGAAERVDGGAYLDTQDLPAVLSLWRFAPAGRERSCTIRFSARAQPIATAPIEPVYRFAALVRKGAIGEREAFARIRPNDCVGQGAPTMLLRAYPDYAKLPPVPGAPAYSVVAFDIDRAGVPVNVGTLAGSGQAKLDEAGRDAVARSRFADGGPRERCTLRFVQWPRPPVEAPETPDIDPLRPADATCPGDIQWAVPPRGDYPAAFQRRGIEGWAIVQFDLAPGGRPGNVAVIASEPAEVFGRHAQFALAGARAQDVGPGAAGCIERVRFRMPA